MVRPDVGQPAPQGHSEPWCSIADSFSSGPARLSPWAARFGLRGPRRVAAAPESGRRSGLGRRCAAVSLVTGLDRTWAGCCWRRIPRPSGARSSGIAGPRRQSRPLPPRARAGLEAAGFSARRAPTPCSPTDIALTDSTTMGLGLLYNGLELRAGDEVLTTTHDFFATHESLRRKAARTARSSARDALSETPCGRRRTRSFVADRRGRSAHARDRVHLGALEHGRQAAAPAHRRRARGTGAGPQRARLRRRRSRRRGRERNRQVTWLRLPGRRLSQVAVRPRGTGFVWGRTRAWDSVIATIPSFSGTASPGAEMTPGWLPLVRAPLGARRGVPSCTCDRQGRVEARIHALNRR